MPYFVVENFKGGVDTRNNTLAALPGTLRQIDNAHITPGGEIEKRKAFVKQFADDASVGGGNLLLANTFGLAELNNDIYVFRDNANDDGYTDWGFSGTVSTPYGDVTLKQQLLVGSDLENAVPGAGPLDTLLDWDVFEGKIYVVAQDSLSGTVQHFYDGARVTSLNAEGNALLCTRIRTFKDKIYGIQDTGIYWSSVGDPTDWNTTGAPATPGDPGYAGFITTSGASSEGENLTGLEIYYDALAVFSQSGVQIWDMDVDPANNTLRQVLRSFGLVGAATPKQYGSGDVLFLSQSGIRSIRARDSSNAGAVSDVGSAIDFDIQKLMREDFAGAAGNARTMREENTGRIWMSFGDVIWVLSQFPGPDVSAWSRYIPETQSGSFMVDEMVQARGMAFIRGGDNVIYLFGGDDDNTYDEIEAVVETPFMVMDNPAAMKTLRGIDLVATGAWETGFCPDYSIDQFVPVASTYNSTLGQQKIGLDGYANAVALRMRAVENKRSALSQAMIHYDLARTD